MDKKIIAISRIYFWLNWSYGILNVLFFYVCKEQFDKKTLFHKNTENISLNAEHSHVSSDKYGQKTTLSRIHKQQIPSPNRSFHVQFFCICSRNSYYTENRNKALTQNVNACGLSDVSVGQTSSYSRETCR